MPDIEITVPANLFQIWHTRPALWPQPLNVRQPWLSRIPLADSLFIRL